MHRQFHGAWVYTDIRFGARERESERERDAHKIVVWLRRRRFFVPARTKREIYIAVGRVTSPSGPDTSAAVRLFLSRVGRADVSLFHPSLERVQLLRRIISARQTRLAAPIDLFFSSRFLFRRLSPHYSFSASEKYVYATVAIVSAAREK